MADIQSVLITGGAGNLGRVVAAELRDRYQVTLFDRRAPSQSLSPFDVPWETDLPFVMGDLTSLEDCMRAIAFAEADAVIHLGALPYPTELSRARGRFGMQQRLPEDETMRVNTMGTFYVVDAARRLGVEKVLFASTYYVLGLGNRTSSDPWIVEYLPIDEEHPCRPESTYGLSKLLGEEILKSFSRAYGLQTVAFRLMGVVYQHRPTGWFNPPDRPPADPDHRGGPIGTTWQYVDARDVAQACALALVAENLEPFEAFYLATDTTLDEETGEVIARCCPDLKEMAANIKGFDGMISIEKARRKLGFTPRYSWRKPTA